MNLLCGGFPPNNFKFSHWIPGNQCTLLLANVTLIRLSHSLTGDEIRILICPLHEAMSSCLGFIGNNGHVLVLHLSLISQFIQNQAGALIISVSLRCETLCQRELSLMDNAQD